MQYCYTNNSAGGEQPVWRTEYIPDAFDAICRGIPKKIRAKVQSELAKLEIDSDEGQISQIVEGHVRKEVARGVHIIQY